MFNSVTEDNSMKARFMLWTSTIAMMGDAPWYGIGNGIFWLLYPQYRNPAESSSGYFSHNDYLQIPLELGIPGALLFVLLLGTIARHIIQLLFLGTVDSRERLIAMGFSGALIAIAVHSLFTFNFYITPILIICGLYTAFIVRRSLALTVEQQSLEWKFIDRKHSFIVLLFMLIPASYISSVGYAYASTHGFILESMHGKTVKEQFYILKRASQIDPTNQWYPLVSAISLSQAGNSVEDEAELKLIYEECTSLLARARELNPLAPDSYLQEAILILNYDVAKTDNWVEKSLSLADRALELNPRTFQARIVKAKILEKSGNAELALEVMLEGIDTTYRNTSELPNYFFYGKELAEKLDNSRAVNAFQLNIEKGNWDKS